VARVHRIGQERPVRVKRYIVKDTVEVRSLLALLVQKYKCLAHKRPEYKCKDTVDVLALLALLVQKVQILTQKETCLTGTKIANTDAEGAVVEEGIIRRIRLFFFLTTAYYYFNYYFNTMLLLRCAHSCFTDAPQESIIRLQLLTNLSC
jgi:hypothetical protein